MCISLCKTIPHSVCVCTEQVLHEEVERLLEGFRPASLAHYDETLVDLLQSEQLLEHMESVCLSLISAHTDTEGESVSAAAGEEPLQEQ